MSRFGDDDNGPSYPLDIHTPKKCRVCQRPEAESHWGGKCATCGRCHGVTPQGRCTFRAETWEGGRAGFCGWHHRVKGDDQSNTFEEFERWVGMLVRGQYCDRWTHFTPVELWNAMGGTRTGQQAAWCGGGDCPHRPDDPHVQPRRPVQIEPKAPPREANEAERAARRALLLEQARVIRGDDPVLL